MIARVSRDVEGVTFIALLAMTEISYYCCGGGGGGGGVDGGDGERKGKGSRLETRVG